MRVIKVGTTKNGDNLRLMKVMAAAAVKGISLYLKIEKGREEYRMQ